MRVRYICLAMFLMLGPGARGQQKPSLGEQEPSLHGPHTSSTTDARKLLRVRTIYVQRIDNALSDKLMEGLSKTGRFRIAADRQEADAVLRGTCSEYRRLRTVRSEVYLNDRTGAPIWQDSVRRPYNPPRLEEAVGETAESILAHLAESIHRAERTQ